MFGRRNKVNAYQPQIFENQYMFDPSYWSGNGQVINRQQALPYQTVYPYWQTAPINWQSPLYSQPYAGSVNSQIPPQWNQPYMANGTNNPSSKWLFQNPLQPQEDPIYGYYSPQQENQFANPYPQQAFMPKQPTGFQSIMNSFKSQDGNLDLNKMVDTAGQMMNAVTQVSSLVKGLGGMFKV